MCIINFRNRFITEARGAGHICQLGKDITNTCHESHKFFCEFASFFPHFQRVHFSIDFLSMLGTQLSDTLIPVPKNFHSNYDGLRSNKTSFVEIMKAHIYVYLSADEKLFGTLGTFIDGAEGAGRASCCRILFAEFSKLRNSYKLSWSKFY